MDRDDVHALGFTFQVAHRFLRHFDGFKAQKDYIRSVRPQCADQVVGVGVCVQNSKHVSQAQRVERAFQARRNFRIRAYENASKHGHSLY